ncbi:transcriptional regulator [Kibdelosporangium aridum]|uniref:Transcriptional regulator n=1 Tax=Kibdelosporangium aridum TaxID=2030 RepID=A0A428Z0C9_KIBAR|nr:BTAD domain-containing putative transcriptional regulator [Kibdelosporangium aridum]RSM77670.1 transcriptional regulator [Kibdelosporangium aridum]
MLVVRVLGPIEVAVGDTRVDLGGSLPRRLLAALVAAGGQVVADDRLAELVWGARPPAKAAATLQVYVSRLRRALGPEGRDLLARDGLGYRFDAARASVDASRFVELIEAGRGSSPDEAQHGLAEALELWRGQPYADLAESDEVDAARSRLTELREVALEERAAARLASGDATGAVPDLEELARAAPLRERRWALLVLALYRCGRQGDALAAVRRARAVLAEELGVDLGVELQDLERQVLAQDPSLRKRPSGRPLTSFLGRDTELDTIAGLFETQRLVSLVGPAGVGKTRLAVEYADDPWFARLADVRQPGELPSVVADAIGLVAVRDDPVSAVVRAIGDRSGLLVLDNCEHIVEAVADLVVAVLPHCPGLRVLATSREPLGVDGEVTIAIQPLPLNVADELLVDRVQAVRPGWQPTEDERAQASRISAALDGLPLAIELAAARARMFGLGEIAERLDDRFAVLGSVPRGSLTAHATLEAAIGWSVDLLSESDRALLLRLWPFEGGFTLEAADAVRPTGRTDTTLELLSSLVTRSVVVADTSEVPTRYLLLESVRAYCQSIDPDPASAQQAHAQWIQELGERWVIAVRTRRAGQIMPAVSRELPNIRAGLAHLREHCPDVALHTFGLFALLFTRHVHKKEAVALAWDLLRAAPDAPVFDRVRAMVTQTALVAIGGDRDGAVQIVNEAFLLSQEIPVGDPVDVAELYCNLAFCAVEVGRHDLAADAATRGIKIAANHGLTGLVRACETVRAVAFVVRAYAAGDIPTMIEAANSARKHGQSFTAGWSSLVMAEVRLRVADEDLDAILDALRHAATVMLRERDVPNALIAFRFGALALARLGRPFEAIQLQSAVLHQAPLFGTLPSAMLSQGFDWVDDPLADILPPGERAAAQAAGARLGITEMAALLG